MYLRLASSLRHRRYVAPPAGNFATSATYNGVTFNFDKTLQTGNFVTGEPWVVSSEAFNITSITPISETENGGVKNGAMQDPYSTQSDVTYDGVTLPVGQDVGQGFDELLSLADDPNVSPANLGYATSLNLDPEINGPISISQGEETSIVKSVRTATRDDPARDWEDQFKTIEKYVPLHVLATAPASDAYPPSASALTKTIWTRSDLDTTVLRSLTMPASFDLTYAGTSPNIPSDLGNYGEKGAYIRRMRIDGGNNYAAEISLQYSNYLLLLHDDTVSESDREAIIDDVVRFAIQLYGLTTRGYDVGNIGAGQGFGVEPWFYYGAFLLQDQGMLDAAIAFGSTMSTHGFWIKDRDVGSPAPGRTDVNGQTFFDEHVGMPFLVPEAWTSDHASRYGNIAWTASAREIMAIQFLQNGPGNVSGTDALLDGGAFDNTNWRAASLAQVDRWVTFEPWPALGYAIGDRERDVLALLKTLSGVPTWSGPPDEMGVGELDDVVTGGDGSLVWDISGFNYATETVTQRDFRYSLDGVQWIVVADIADDSSETGLMKSVDHYTGFRQTSASGTGPWSQNYPRSDGGPDRGVVVTTGAATAAVPSFAVSPAIQYRKHLLWEHPSWAPASSTLTENELELACGVGYQSATVYPAPTTYAFQWKRDAVNIAGATSQTYTRVAADAGTDLTCEVTATNSEGSASSTSAAVSVPVLTTLLSTKLIDTDFRGAFATDYEAELSNVDVYNSLAVHQPTQEFSYGATPLPIYPNPSIVALTVGADAGALWCDKTGSHPTIELPFKNSAVADTTYNVTGQFVVLSTNALRVDFEIRNSAGDALFAISVENADFPSFPWVEDFSNTIVVAPGETDLDWSVYAYVRTPTGGESGGDIYLTQITVEEQ